MLKTHIDPTNNNKRITLINIQLLPIGHIEKKNQQRYKFVSHNI
jgi:hypothetical protein